MRSVLFEKKVPVDPSVRRHNDGGKINERLANMESRNTRIENKIDGIQAEINEMRKQNNILLS